MKLTTMLEVIIMIKNCDAYVVSYGGTEDWCVGTYDDCEEYIKSRNWYDEAEILYVHIDEDGCWDYCYERYSVSR